VGEVAVTMIALAWWVLVAYSVFAARRRLHARA
jgi:hypothetical protein